MTEHRSLGQVACDVETDWFREQLGDAIITGWDDLDDSQREPYERIGAAVAAAERERILAIAGYLKADLTIVKQGHQETTTGEIEAIPYLAFRTLVMHEPDFGRRPPGPPRLVAAEDARPETGST